jgi:hypothetical protein
MKNYIKLLLLPITALVAGAIGLTVWNNLPKKTPEQKILEEFDSQRSVTLGSKKIIVPENWSLLEVGPGETENSLTVTFVPTQQGPTLTPSPAGVTLTLEELPEGTPTDQENLQKFAVASVEASLPEKAQVLKSPRSSERNPNAAEASFIYTTGEPSAEAKEATWACAIYSITSPSSQLTAVLGVNQKEAAQYSKDLQAIRASLGL